MQSDGREGQLSQSVDGFRVTDKEGGAIATFRVHAVQKSEHLGVIRGHGRQLFTRFTLRGRRGVFERSYDPEILANALEPVPASSDGLALEGRTWDIDQAVTAQHEAVDALNEQRGDGHVVLSSIVRRLNSCSDRHTSWGKDS
jgi:hypothetical protein